MGQPYKIKHGLVVADEVIKVTGHDKKAYYNGNELTTEARLSSEINTLSTEVNTRIDNLDATHTADIAQIRLELDNLETDTTAYVDNRVDILEVKVETNITNIGDMNQLVSDATDLVTAINIGSGKKLFYPMWLDRSPSRYRQPNDPYIIPDDVTDFYIGGDEDNFYATILPTRTKDLTIHADDGHDITLFARWDIGGPGDEETLWSGSIRYVDPNAAWGLTEGADYPTNWSTITWWGGTVTITQVKDGYNFYPDGKDVWTVKSAKIKSSLAAFLKAPFGEVEGWENEISQTDNPNVSNIRPHIYDNRLAQFYDSKYNLYFQTSDAPTYSIPSRANGQGTTIPNLWIANSNYATGNLRLPTSPTDGMMVNFAISAFSGSWNIITTTGHPIYSEQNDIQINRGTTWGISGAWEFSGKFDEEGGKWVLTYISSANGIMGYISQGNFKLSGRFDANPTKGDRNTIIGGGAGNIFNANNDYNVGLGYDTLSTMTTGIGNTAIGYNSMRLISSGQYNIALGYQADDGKSTGSRNIAIGSSTDTASTGNDRIAIGYGATANANFVCAFRNSTGSMKFGFNHSLPTAHIHLESPSGTEAIPIFNAQAFGTNPTHGIKISAGLTGNLLDYSNLFTGVCSISNSGHIVTRGYISAAEKGSVITGNGGSIDLNAYNYDTSTEANQTYFVDTSVNNQTFTISFGTNFLQPGSYVSFVDMKGTFNTNPTTITINSGNFEGVAAPNTVVLDVDNTITKFVYTDSTYGWKRITTLNQ